MVGSNGIEPSTSRLSGVRSNRLSYKPMYDDRFISSQMPGLSQYIILYDEPRKLNSVPNTY